MTPSLAHILDAVSRAPTADLRRLARDAAARLQAHPELEASLLVLLGEALTVWTAAPARTAPQGDLVLEDLGAFEPGKQLVTQAGRVVELMRVALEPHWSAADLARHLGRLGMAVELLLAALPMLLEEAGDPAARVKLVALLSILREARP